MWGFHPAPDIERAHLAFLKRLLGVRKGTQNDFVYGTLGIYHMEILRQCRIVKYWLKLVSGTKSHYINTVYSSSLDRVDNMNSCNWDYNVTRERTYSREKNAYL